MITSVVDWWDSLSDAVQEHIILAAFIAFAAAVVYFAAFP